MIWNVRIASVPDAVQFWVPLFHVSIYGFAVSFCDSVCSVPDTLFSTFVSVMTSAS